MQCETTGCNQTAEIGGLCVRCLDAEDEARAERIDRERERAERLDFEDWSR